MDTNPNHTHIAKKALAKPLFPVYLTFFLDSFGIGMIYPLFTPLLLFPEYHILSTSISILRKTILLGLLISAFPFAQFFGAPLIGAISDRLGRKKCFLITVSATGIGYFITGLGITLGLLPLMFIGRLWTGFFAGNLTLCLATIADLRHDKESRASTFGMMAGFGGIGFIASILLGSIFSYDKTSILLHPSMAFWLMTVFSAVNLICIIRLFHESHSTTLKERTHVFKGLHQFSLAFSHKPGRILYSIYFFFSLGWVCMAQLTPTYVYEHFKATQKTVVYILLIMGGMWALSNLVLQRFLVHKFKISWILCFSLLCLSVLVSIISIGLPFGVYAFFYAGSIIAAALSWTNCLSLVSLKADLEIQGSILGINQAVGTVSAIFGPLIGGIIAGIDNQLVYLFAAFMHIIAFLILVLNHKSILPPLAWKKEQNQT